MRSHSMPQPNEMTPLGLKILDHWKRHRPKMVTDLQRQKRLEQAVFAAQELTTDLLHDLAVIQRMDYQAAWEIATREWAFLPDEEDQLQLSFDPANLTSADAPARLPHNRRARRRNRHTKREGLCKSRRD